MRIVLDLQGAQTESRFRGIGRYSLSLAQSIARNKGDHEVIVLLNGQLRDSIEGIRTAFNGLLPQQNIVVWYGPENVAECVPGNSWRRKAAECLREAFIKKLNPDVVHISTFFEGAYDDCVSSIGGMTKDIPTVVAFYDLIPLMNPESYLDPFPVYKEFYLKKIEALKKAQGWFAISESSRNEGVELLSFPSCSIFNISTAADETLSKVVLADFEKSALWQKFNIVKDFVLYTGGADIRKNLDRLVQAYALMPSTIRQTHQLVLAGKMPVDNVASLKAHARSYGLHELDVVFTGYVTDQELAALYSYCKAFVFPSWHEGFGLPALEAMCCGAPVIGSNVSSIPEVIGFNEALFDPLDVKQIASKLCKALSDETFRAQLIAHASEQVRLFSWDRSAKRALEAFEKICDEHGRGGNSFTNLEVLTSDVESEISLISSDLPTYEDIRNCAIAMASNFACAREKRLFVDISQLVHVDAKSGIQRVVRSVLKELLESPPKGFSCEPVYATMDSPGYRYAREFTAIHFPEHSPIDVQEDSAIEYGNEDIFLGLDLQHHVVIRQQHTYQLLRNAGVKVYFVVYDLLPVLMPEVFVGPMAELHSRWLKAISANDGVLCISRSVCNEMETWLKQHSAPRHRPLQVDWFHLGADVENSIPSKGLPDDAGMVLAKLGECPTFLSVGTIEPRKAHDQTLKAFNQLWKEGIEVNLVLVGQSGWNVDELIHDITNHKLLGERLFWLKGISDEYLEKIYLNATCLVFSSKGEGFGLPLIEAAQSGLPIIARDIPVFREIAGDNAYYFKGSNAEDLSKEIKAWLALKAQDVHPSSTNMKWLTWKQSAEQLVSRLTATA